MLRAGLTKWILVNQMAIRRLLRWSLLVAATVGVTVPADPLGVPSAALFAALIVGIALALLSLAPSGIPRPAGHCRPGRARRLHRHDGPPGRGRRARSALADRPRPSRSPPCCSAWSAGRCWRMHRDVTPLTGSLALVAGGASGLVAIARELGGDDRVVAVVQYLRVALVTASMPVLVTLDLSRRQIAPGRRSNSNRLRPLVSEHRHAHRAGCRRCHRRPVDPAARRRAARAARADGRSRAHRPVVRTVGADGAGAGRLRADRLAGRARVHPRIVARCRTACCRRPSP